MAGHECVVRHFPFRIGRAATSNIRLEEPGVWDQHLQITLSGDTFEFETQPGASLLVNGSPVAKGRLRNGDSLQPGSAELRFSLSPTRQRNLIGREILVWLGLAALCLGQVGLIYWLLQE